MTRPAPHWTYVDEVPGGFAWVCDDCPLTSGLYADPAIARESGEIHQRSKGAALERDYRRTGRKSLM